MKLLLLTILIGIAATQEDEKPINKEYLEGYNKFTANVYNEFKKTHPENFVLSPLSVDIILALAEYGSKGETSRQLVKGLSLPEDKAKLKDAIITLTDELNSNKSYTLASANKVYVKKNYELNAEFQKFAENVYKSEVENVDFEDKAAAADTINKWVGDRTLNKIQNLIDKDDLNIYTRAILVNALYFRGEWITYFDKEATKKGIFYLSDNGKSEVDFMKVTSTFKYYENHNLNAKFLELPYIGFDVTLTIVLPNANDGLTELENKLSEVLDFTHYKYERLKVTFPKFKIDTKVEFKTILQSLGIVDAFEDTAEFPDITKEKLKISKVLQKAVIEIDEEGTTAAAASAVIMELVRSALIPLKEPKEFTADHPFIFVLKYKSVVLFIGHYSGK